jgi:hypothetical protein
MNTANWIRPLFWLAAAYDGILGAIFLASPSWVFTQFNVAPPNHFGYVQFPAALLVIFGMIFVAIARDPVANRSQILYGILLKVAYCSIAGYYWVTADIPVIWKPFVWADFIMGLLFIVAYASIEAGPRSAAVRA